MTSTPATVLLPSDPADGTVARLVHEQSTRQPDAVALLAPGRSPLTYAQLWQQMQRIAQVLHSQGATPTVRVAVMLPNGPEMACAFLGVAACAAFVPLNPASQAAELRVHLADTRARIVIVREGEHSPLRTVAQEMGLTALEARVDPALPAGRFQLAPSASDRVEAPRPAGPRDVALLLPTSGTTARPKIVLLEHAQLAASVRDIIRHFALSPSDRCLNVRPLFHVNGLVSTVLATVASGGSVVCTAGLDGEAFFDWVARFQPTWFSAVPTMHQWILAHGDQYRRKAPQHRFRFLRSGASALAPATLRSLEALTGAPLIETYGMTERTPLAINPLPPRLRKPGSVGLPAGVEIALLDEVGRPVPQGMPGEIAVRDAGIIGHYQSTATTDTMARTDGWFRTGDQGRFDDDGYLFITGRLKEIVNRGGQKIAPREVDEALLEHPAVAQAAVFGVPHPTLGEELAAAVVLRDGAAVAAPALRNFLLERLAPYKLPSTFLFVDALPVGELGKIKRTQLREAFAPLLQKDFASLQTDTQRSVGATFREVLRNGPVGLHDSFFALGGDSLSGMRVIARVNERHAVTLTASTLFASPTIAELAQVVDGFLAARTDAADEIARDIAQMSDEEVRRLLAQEDPSACATDVAASNASGRRHEAKP